MKRVPLAIRVAIIGVLGIAFAGSVLSAVSVARKLNGGGAACSWRRTLLYGFDTLLFSAYEARTSWSLKLKASDPKLDLQQFSTASRDFWIRHAGARKDGRTLLAYLLSEHAWMAAVNGGDHVQRGDIVLDCGAHVGVFTDLALRRGASRVVAIEPDPLNLECLRRNFSAEIAAGRVLLAPLGVWSDERTITLYTGKENSGMNSMIWDQKAGQVEVRVTTIDQLLRELKLPRVDFIKMDIEGAEREALKGALGVLQRDRPRLMLDSYHRPDDMQVLPPIIHQGNPAYTMHCGPCEPSLVPHVTYYR